MGNTGSLHGHGNSHGTHLAISHISAWEFFLPADHFGCTHETVIQSASRCNLIIVGHHAHTLTYHIFHADLYRIHTDLTCQFINYRFQGKYTLCGAIAPICTGCTDIGINYIKGMSVSFQIGCIQGNRLVSGQSCRCRSMVSISTGIGQVVNFNGTDRSVMAGSNLHSHFHLMTGRTGNLAFFSAIKQLGWLFCHPGHKSRINLCYNGLFGSESATNTRLQGTYF